MKMVTLDFETASRADLLKIGAWKYAEDQSTFIIMVQIKIAIDGRAQPTRVILEREIHKIDHELLDLCNDPSVIFSAQNASFEQAMWHYHMVPAGYPPLPPERWHDTMAVSAMRALPMGLDAVVTALELPVRKDMEGHSLMLKLCKPDRDGGWSHHTAQNIGRLAEYGRTDCDAQYGLYLATKGLGPSERETWILDQKINQRGIRIDREFVHACMDVLEQVRVPMTERFHELTGLKPTQREKILNWVNDQGVPLGDMKKATLDAVLDPDDEFGLEEFNEPLPYNVHEAISLRRSLASSSVAKLQRMLDCACLDGRVRYATQYHGARTGRDAGRLIQVQNYPRGEISERQGLTADILADAIMTRDVNKVRELWGDDVFSAIISSLRSCIVPEPGKVLVAGDFAQVEAKNLLSMAGQHDKAEMLHSGMDAYAEMGSLIFKKPVNKKDNPFERQVGKNCLSADTMVLTSNGWKTIVNVQDTDLLWDGEAWVTHSGLAYQGWHQTLSLSGLRLTADHLVYTGDRWFRAEEVTESTFRLALAFAKGHGPYLDTHTESVGVSRGIFANATADMDPPALKDTISQVGVLQDVTHARNERAQKLQNRGSGISTYAPIPPTVQGFLTGFPVLSKGVKTRRVLAIADMAAEVLNSVSGAVKNVLNISFLFQGGMIQGWKLIESIMIKGMKKVIFGSRHEEKTLTTEGQQKNCKIDLMKPLKKFKCFEPVYDLVNAGPRHRFMVMTCDGPLIVHNCVMGNGYGLGPVGFRARFCPKEPIDLAMLAVNTYRTEFAPLVPKFWYGLWEASVSAVWCSHAKAYAYDGIEFRKEGDFLTMRLPSGRKLYYHRPRQERTMDPKGNERPSWSFMSYHGKKFRRHLAWHGMLTADCIQGSARDLMVNAMKRAEAAGLNTIFKVHDELVFEETDRDDLVLTVKQIMEDIELWAIERKLRVKAEVDKMVRYRK